jgi:hypothetical protein
MRWDVVDRYWRVMIDHLGDASLWETVAKLAPIATALIALAASLALYSIGVQRDVARRRAAIDFFLKTETDDKLIDLYELFKSLKPDLSHSITSSAAAWRRRRARRRFQFHVVQFCTDGTSLIVIN